MNYQKNNAPFLDVPEGEHQHVRDAIHYGNQHVPMPNNRKAMEVDAERVMREVMEAK